MSKFSKIVVFLSSALLILLLVLYKFGGLEKCGQGAPETSFDSAEGILEKLTLEEKVGQLFLIGFEGKVMSAELKKSFETIRPGGILLLSRNIDSSNQLKNLIKDLQEVSLRETGLPLFVAVDQEGGPICRIGFLEEKTSQSKITDIGRAREVGLRRGKELKELGVNLNLAPILDITNHDDFLYKRSFQKGVEETGILAKSLISGQKEAGILTAIKHFPGYGGISFDPEREKLPVSDKVPEISQFQKAFEGNPEMIMTANVIYSEIDRKLPFPLSSTSIQLLKNKIPGNYLIISDDLSSPVLKKEFSLENSIILAGNSGVDILLVAGFDEPKDPSLAYDFLLKAAQSNKVSQEKIKESVLKIIKLKQALSY